MKHYIVTGINALTGVREAVTIPCSKQTATGIVENEKKKADNFYTMLRIEEFEKDI